MSKPNKVEEFEKWANERGWNLTKVGNSKTSYIDAHTTALWVGWQVGESNGLENAALALENWAANIDSCEGETDAAIACVHQQTIFA